MKVKVILFPVLWRDLHFVTCCALFTTEFYAPCEFYHMNATEAARFLFNDVPLPLRQVPPRVKNQAERILGERKGNKEPCVNAI